MDTRIWGPSGWLLLHTIAENNELSDRKKISFLETLSYTLPCKYCRESFIVYADLLDLKNSTNVSKTLYRIHNKVNNKLVRQGYVVCRASSHEAIQKRYIRLNKKIVELEQDDLGFIFLGCVVFNYPKTKPSPELTKQYEKFFKLLSQLYPVRSVRKKLKKYHEESPIQLSLKNRSSLVQWFKKYPIENIQKMKHTKYFEYFESFRAGCSATSCRNRGRRKTITFS
jgi:hypothetical protein